MARAGGRLRSDQAVCVGVLDQVGGWLVASGFTLLRTLVFGAFMDRS